jgi:hypothetical protein
MVRMVAWGMIDVPQDSYSDTFNQIECEVWRELKLTALRIFCMRCSPHVEVWRLKQQGAPGNPLREGTFRECCQTAVEILDAAA